MKNWLNAHPNTKRHLVSAGVTFVSGFALVMLMYLSEVRTPGDLSFHLVMGAFIGGFMAGIRAVAKYLLETFFTER